MTKQEALSYHGNFLENVQESAADEIRRAYTEMNDGIERYLVAIQEDMFQQAFRYGYEKGFEAASRAKTA